MTPAQQAVIDATSARDAAQVSYTEVQAKLDRFLNAEGDLVANLAAKRDAFRSASALAEIGGSKPSLPDPDLVEAPGPTIEVLRRDFREARDLVDEAKITREELTVIVSAARSQVELCENGMMRARSTLAQERASEVKARLLVIGAEFGKLKVDLRQLARFAAACEQAAGNRGADPVGGASGERCPPFTDALDAALAGPEPAAITVADLLPAPEKRKAATT